VYKITHINKLPASFENKIKLRCFTRQKNKQYKVIGTSFA
jgi:hypothetical protein